MSALAVAKPGSGFKNEKIGDRVRRNSLLTVPLSDPTSWERRFQHRMSDTQKRALLFAAKMWDEYGPKRKGRHNGPLGFRGMRLLDLMVRQLGWEGGYLRNLSIKDYAKRCRCSVQTIVEAIKALCAAGFLIKERRKRQLEERGPTGRLKAVQERNIYMLQLPAKAQALAAQRRGKRIEKPESQATAEKRARAEHNRREIEKATRLGRAPILKPEPTLYDVLAKYDHLCRPPDSIK